MVVGLFLSLALAVGHLFLQQTKTLNMKKIEKEIKVTRYVAFDGTEFETEAECQHYEGSAFGQLIEQLNNCILSHQHTPDGNHTYFLVPKTRHDIFVLQQILKMAGIDNPCGEVHDRLTIMSVRLQCNTVESADVADFEAYVNTVTNGQYAVVSTIKEERKAK